MQLEELAPALRLIREEAVAMAQCPGCGLRLALGAEGTTWSARAASDVGDRMILELGSLEREELWVLFLNAKNSVTGQVRVYQGNVSASLVRIGELFTEAVRRGVPRLILCHNHPSGDPTPSADDLSMTRQMVEAGRLLDIEVLDHLIIGHGRYVSLKEQGLGFGGEGQESQPKGV